MSVTERGNRFRWVVMALALPAVAAAALLGPAALRQPDTELAAQEMPEPRWSVAQANALLAAIGQVSAHGLTPADYEPDALRTAIAQGESFALDTLADTSALTLARDYARGRVAKPGATGWFIEPGAPDDRALVAGLEQARDAGGVAQWLAGLPPRHEPYAALMGALAATPPSDQARITKLRVNLERWRWMPREIGPDAIWVNVPTYRLRLIRDGNPVAEHDVIVGAPDTPTPQITAQSQSVTVNPWWTLPPSVLKEGGRFRGNGYVTVQTKSGPRIRQRPGPRNALGKVKFEMPNAHAIYLHDTPAKALFARRERALSHGCIRVEDVEGLAARLADTARLDKALAAAKTATVPLEKELPVYIVYFTATATADGGIVLHGDPYDRDAAVAAAMSRPRAGMPSRMASPVAT